MSIEDQDFYKRLKNMNYTLPKGLKEQLLNGVISTEPLEQIVDSISTQNAIKKHREIVKEQGEILTQKFLDLAKELAEENKKGD